MKHIKITLLLVAALLLFSCNKKKKKINGAVIVTVYHEDKRIANPTVYMKSGGAHNPQIPFSQYDDYVAGDTSGIVMFSNLLPDDYYFAAVVVSGTATLRGETSARVYKTVPPNFYERRIVVR